MSQTANPAAISSRPADNTRYNSLDALRAYAMLLGIFFHVAWFFLPYESGTPMSDVAENQPCNFFFYLTHIFRMQLFFLLAGFFARLVFLRRGYLGFAWHRFSRIAIPFAAGWVIMYPLFTLYWVWGGLQSGRILTDEPFWQFLGARILADELSWFTLTHLWFLYYLLLIYVLAITAVILFRHLIDRHEYLRRGIDKCFAWCINSPLNVVWLSIPLWLCLWWNRDWFGITTPSDSLKPHKQVLTAYTLFFLVGWLLHGQAHLLQQLKRRWLFNLACGTAISVPLFLFFTQGIQSGTITWAYPMVFGNEIEDYSAIRDVVRDADGAGMPDDYASLGAVLSPTWRRFLEDTMKPSREQKAGFANEITQQVILNPTAFQPANARELEALKKLKQEVRRRGEPEIFVSQTTEGTPLENRWLFEATLPPGTFTPNIVNQTWYQTALALFSAAYALSNWLLVFGSMGLFMRFFANPSPLVRYIADSSYWLYIIHLPIMCQINVLAAEIRWHWILKTLLYTVITFAIMMPSYHYLVRSTWLGRVLNGRTYPFRPWFRYKKSNDVKPPSDPPPEIERSESLGSVVPR